MSCTVCVFPTPVGVFLEASFTDWTSLSLPHARGGVSNSIQQALAQPQSSPRPWGCFWRYSDEQLMVLVFPTPVGVFLCPTASGKPKKGLPHARGGVSIFWHLPIPRNQSSPRPWGCFPELVSVLVLVFVFPTPEGGLKGTNGGIGNNLGFILVLHWRLFVSV